MDYRFIVLFCHYVCKAYISNIMGKFSEKFPGTENSIVCRIYCHRPAVVYCAAFPPSVYLSVLDICTDKMEELVF